MKIAIVQFPGATGSREVKRSLWRLGMEPVDVFWYESANKLTKCAAFIVLGGEIALGSFHLSRMAAHSPLMQKIKEQAEVGKIVLGIGVGAQIILAAGLIVDDINMLSLARNKQVYFDKIVHQGFCYAATYIRLHENAQSPVFIGAISHQTLFELPLAQTEGRFVISPLLIQPLEEQGLVVFHYCDKFGYVKDEFPTNPNASIRNIAALSNYAGNVFAMVPHPEASPQGDAIFTAIRDFVEEKENLRQGKLILPPCDRSSCPIVSLEKQVSLSESWKLFFHCPWLEQETKLIQDWLSAQLISVQIKRFIYWTIICSEETKKQIKKTEALMALQSTPAISIPVLNRRSEHMLLVQEKDDIIGIQKRQLLMNHFEIDGIQSMQSGILWLFESDDASLLEKIIATGIVFDPNVHFVGSTVPRRT